MNSIRSAIENTVSISLFNKGLAGKIFEEVKSCGAKVVMKNNSAECVLLSPNEYLHLLDELNEAKALAEANKRLTDIDPSLLVSLTEIKETTLNLEELENPTEVEFE